MLVHDDERERVAVAVGEAGDEDDLGALVFDEQALGLELGDDVLEHRRVERLAALLEVVDPEQVVDRRVGAASRVEELEPHGLRRPLPRLELHDAVA